MRKRTGRPLSAKVLLLKRSRIHRTLRALCSLDSEPPIRVVLFGNVGRENSLRQRRTRSIDVALVREEVDRVQRRVGADEKLSVLPHLGVRQLEGRALLQGAHPEAQQRHCYAQECGHQAAHAYEKQEQYLFSAQN